VGDLLTGGAKSVQDRRVPTRLTWEVFVIADLDTLLIALYVELTDRIIPSLGKPRGRLGRPPEVTDAELACLAVAQVLLRYDDERHWLRAAAFRVGHLFPRLLGQSEYNDRLKAAAPLMEAALRWLAGHTPGSAELLRLMDATPVPCGQSALTARRSDLFGYAGYGYCPSHSRWYWGGKLMLIVTCDGTVTGFALANPKLAGEREAARTMLEDQPASRPPPGTAIVTDKGLSGQETEEFFARPGLELTLIRPARKDEKPRYFPNRLRQRVEAIIWTLKNQLGLERHGGRVPAGLWARIVQRLLALNTAIWHNAMIGAPVKRSLIAYDH
jgi:Transposase DDE domain